MGINSFLKENILKKKIKINEGRAKMFGKIDYIMIPSSGMAEMIQKIGNDKGEDYLFNLGYGAGEDGANEMIQKLGMFQKTIASNLNVIQSMFETLGFGKMDIKSMKSKKGKVLLHLKNHPVIDYAKKFFGENSRICCFYRGIFSAHGEKELKIKNCKLVETKCITKKHNYCEWSSGFRNNLLHD